MVMPKALVTGNRGFLGRHFAKELAARGYYVTGYDTAVTPSQDCRIMFRSETKNLGNPHRPRYDLVVHCAAVVGGRETIENSPLETADSLAIDAEMFRWAAATRPGRVLYISSSAAYPSDIQRLEKDRKGIMLKEEYASATGSVIGRPDEVYGWSKLTGELLADRLRRAGVPVTVVRPFSGYGGDQDVTYPFRAILERVRAGADPVEVWSDGYRDWIHVDDVVRGALAVVRSGTELPVNLCTGRPTSFTGLARVMLAAAGRPGAKVSVRDDRPRGVDYRVGDPSRMLGFYTPRVSLEEGVARALGS